MLNPTTKHIKFVAIALFAFSIIGFPLAINFVDSKCESVSYEMEQENARSNNTADKRTEGSIEANIAAPGVSQNRTSLNQVTPKSKEPTAHHKWKEQFYCHAGFSELGIAWFTFFLFSATGALWFVTYSLARDAKEGAEEQATNMSKSIAEAANAANAMKEIAAVTKENATLMEGILRKQMRAYIAVDIGGATYQDANLRFEAAPVIVNTGNTPAKHVSYIPAGLPRCAR